MTASPPSAEPSELPASSPTLRALTLDATGTLITLARPVGETYAEIARSFGARLDPEAVDVSLRAVFSEMPPLSFPGASPNRIPGLERGWWRELVSRVVAAAGRVESFSPFFDALYEHYARGGAWRAYPEAVEALQAVRAHGCRTAVISNFDSRLMNILRALELDHYFDLVTYSSASGAAKPENAIFALTLSRLGVRPEEALHAGNDPRTDVEGAHAAGLIGVLVDRTRARADTKSGVVSSLLDLEAWFRAD